MSGGNQKRVLDEEVMGRLCQRFVRASTLSFVRERTVDKYAWRPVKYVSYRNFQLARSFVGAPAFQFERLRPMWWWETNVIPEVNTFFTHFQGWNSWLLKPGFIFIEREGCEHEWYGSQPICESLFAPEGADMFSGSKLRLPSFIKQNSGYGIAYLRVANRICVPRCDLSVQFCRFPASFPYTCLDIHRRVSIGRALMLQNASSRTVRHMN